MALLDKPSEAAPDKPTGNSPGDMNKSASNIIYSGATELSTNASFDGESFSSSDGGENALLITGGEISLSNVSINKTGGESGEDSDFYGTNAAVLVTGGSANIKGGTITTAGAHANALFAYGDGVIDALDTKITTSGDNSGGIMVTGGGTFAAENLAVSTSGNSSAAIRSDRGGGEITVEGGDYKTSGVGSPVVYSTADIYIQNGAHLTSTSSEGIVIEGSNRVSLEDTTLTATNNSLNGNSETYKSIFIYQSMSGDAEEGVGTFSADRSLITTNKGDTFFITNTTAEINLSENKFVNSDADSAFLRAGAGKWGTAGANGGKVKLGLSEQVVEGDIVLDEVSSLSFEMLNESFYKGKINSTNSSDSVILALDESSTFVLTGDTYLTSLKNIDADNTNIYSNGFKLFVNGIEARINTAEAPAVPEVNLTVAEYTATGTISDAILVTTPAEKCLGMLNGKCTDTENLIPLCVGAGSILLIIVCIIILIARGKKKGKVPPVSPETTPSENPFRDTVSPLPTPKTPENEPQKTPASSEPTNSPDSKPEPETPTHSEPESPDFLK